MNPSNDLVTRVWKLCSVLRKDGITYQQYVTELTYLLFLKMLDETGLETELPPETRWSHLMALPAKDRLQAYRATLAKLGSEQMGVTEEMRNIFTGAATLFRDARNLDRIMTDINGLTWAVSDRDSFGDLYEGLLERNAEETKRGAGQYFTPRALIEAIVQLVAPQPGEVVQDPAAGTGGFLVAADRYARRSGSRCHVSGMENVHDTHRLLLMNMLLHDIPGDAVHFGDTLSSDHFKLPKADVVLTNPPFGPAGGRPDRDDLKITGTSSSFAPPFIEHCIGALKANGRAAIVVPDNMLYEGGRVRALRSMLMAECELQAILSLPPGIFYAQGVKTSVLFFRRSGTGTRQVWFYDLRSQMPAFGRSSPLQRKHFESFERFFIKHFGTSADPSADSDDPRAYRETRQEIADRGDDLVPERSASGVTLDDELLSPEDMIAAAAEYMAIALGEVRALAEDYEAYRPDGRGSR